MGKLHVFILGTILTLIIFLAGTQFSLLYPELTPNISEFINSDSKIVNNNLQEDQTSAIINNSLDSVVTVSAGIDTGDVFVPSLEKEIGSGFVFGPGLIATNKHVVDNERFNYYIVTNDGKRIKINNILEL